MIHTLVLVLFIFSANGASTDQSKIIENSQLKSGPTTIVYGRNPDLDTNWTTVYWMGAAFGEGKTSTTSHVYGLVLSVDYSSGMSRSFITTIYKKTLTNTVINKGNDTPGAAVTGNDTVISIPTGYLSADYYKIATGPSCAAIFHQDFWYIGSSELGLYVTVVNENFITHTIMTIPVGQRLYLGNIWYDRSSDAFFYTYTHQINDKKRINSICFAYIGGIFTNGTPYWSTPLALVSNQTGCSVGSIMGGGYNSIDAPIYVSYSLSSIIPGEERNEAYYSKVIKSSKTTSVEPSKLLVSGNYDVEGIWASNDTTFVITLYEQDTYRFIHYFNGTSDSVDADFSCVNVESEPPIFMGWLTGPGYTLLVQCQPRIPASDLNVNPDGYPKTYQIETFYANRTVRSPQLTFGPIEGPVSFYQDIEGSLWIGWTDFDGGTSYTNKTLFAKTYKGYLAKFQGETNPQPNPPSPDPPTPDPDNKSNFTWLWILAAVGLILSIAAVLWCIYQKRRNEQRRQRRYMHLGA